MSDMLKEIVEGATIQRRNYGLCCFSWKQSITYISAHGQAKEVHEDGQAQSNQSSLGTQLREDITDGSLYVF